MEARVDIFPGDYLPKLLNDSEDRATVFMLPLLSGGQRWIHMWKGRAHTARSAPSTARTPVVSITDIRNALIV